MTFFKNRKFSKSLVFQRSQFSKKYVFFWKSDFLKIFEFWKILFSVRKKSFRFFFYSFYLFIIYHPQAVQFWTCGMLWARRTNDHFWSKCCLGTLNLVDPLCSALQILVDLFTPGQTLPANQDFQLLQISLFQIAAVC